ncbi:unnamed protein product [Orchesella dallaii]|uniref:Acetyl-CoA carboxylase n=1 Tax=Orchesella dallaii TaxID=48710 RepID=A0ABP1Q9T4_9HEXA
MWALGDKIASSIVAQTAGVPTLPWSGSGLIASSGKDKRIKISSDLYRKGCMETAEEGLVAAQKIGFPVMIKASEGGGGKGIRKAETMDDFSNLFRQVQSEVPGSPIFIMKLATCARHLEVQLLGDQYGNAISLFGRDCSIQRRHQKIIEEAPCVIAKKDVFEEMEKASVRLAKMVGYVSAGTVEYLFFIRCIIRHSDLITKEASFEYHKNEGERLLLEAMDELEIAFSHAHAKNTDCNHIFLNFVPTVIMDPGKVEESVCNMVPRYGPRIWKLRVVQAELKMTIRMTPTSKTMPIRLCLANESGYYLNINLYKEFNDPQSGLIKFEIFGKKPGPLHGFSVSSPYKTKNYLQQKRFQAQSNDTTYVYDFPHMYRQVLERLWKEYKELNPDNNVEPPEQPLQYIDLVLDSQNDLVEEKRSEGENEIGMVAWKMKLFTPEFPHCSDIIVIANDITHLIGSFSVREDLLFLKASELSRSLKIPRIYLSANSGSRIGLAEEIKHRFKICWEDASDHEKGFRYIYLTPEEYSKEDGIGVENLRYAGMIAGETLQAYKEVVTMSMVSYRAIGIGAYLVRLGQRVIQVGNSYTILTGYGALNKLLEDLLQKANIMILAIKPQMFPGGDVKCLKKVIGGGSVTCRTVMHI